MKKSISLFSLMITVIIAMTSCKQNVKANETNSGDSIVVAEKAVEHEWVDLGLSVKWATCNVGANSPSDYGNYYAWAETTPKNDCSSNNCFDCYDGYGEKWGIYRLDSLTHIAPSSGHDAARENWGGTWRMPTQAENEELLKKCKWEWTTMDGHRGCTVTGPNGNSIFLPAAGMQHNIEICNAEEAGFYWSSTLSPSNSAYACYIIFQDGFKEKEGAFRRWQGRSVRPVVE